MYQHIPGDIYTKQEQKVLEEHDGWNIDFSSHDTVSNKHDNGYFLVAPNRIKDYYEKIFKYIRETTPESLRNSKYCEHAREFQKICSGCEISLNVRDVLSDKGTEPMFGWHHGAKVISCIFYVDTICVHNSISDSFIEPYLREYWEELKTSDDPDEMTFYEAIKVQNVKTGYKEDDYTGTVRRALITNGVFFNTGTFAMNLNNLPTVSEAMENNSTRASIQNLKLFSEATDSCVNFRMWGRGNDQMNQRYDESKCHLVELASSHIPIWFDNFEEYVVPLLNEMIGKFRTARKDTQERLKFLRAEKKRLLEEKKRVQEEMDNIAQVQIERYDKRIKIVKMGIPETPCVKPIPSW